MAEIPEPVDFDARPPMPLDEYAQTVERVNVGYDLAFTLTECFLRALHQPDLRLLVVGAGGGAEIERFLPDNAGWRVVGVDPSRDMLAQAQDKAARVEAGQRVTLVRGAVQDLPVGELFGAATCLFVLHFLPDEQKLALMRGVRQRLQPGSPFLVVSGVRPDNGDLRDDFIAAWQQYGEKRGMPAERMAQIIGSLVEQMEREGAPAEETYVRLLHEAGFPRVSRFLSALGAIVGWLAR